MMEAAVGATVGIQVSDVSGQRMFRAPAVPKHFTVGEMVRGLIEKMGLMPNDVDGHALQYQARLDREGRHLNGAEMVGDALRDEDSVVLTPNIDAG